jgi:hypothetical protein
MAAVVTSSALFTDEDDVDGRRRGREMDAAAAKKPDAGRADGDGVAAPRFMRGPGGLAGSGVDPRPSTRALARHAGRSTLRGCGRPRTL